MWRGRRGFDFRERVFERGDLKYVILELVADQPRHGYEVIRALEDRFGGFYSPSPGAVYPTLQMLEELGYVSASEQDGKKTYTITEAGRAFLKERKPYIEEMFGRMRDRWDPAMAEELHRLRHELRDMGRSFAEEARRRWPDPEQQRKIRDVIGRARSEIESILRERQSPGGTTTV
jgi:DNA-binding PadR family transcriptional regulator